MERTLSVEEKIRRAEEIYERRKRDNMRPIATVNVSEKKDIKLLKKMIIQVLICVAIYLIIYTIQNNNYIFSEDFIKKANEILSYDTNFVEIYENIKNQVISIFQKPEDAIGGAEAETQNNEVNNNENLENTNNEGETNQTTNQDVTQENAENQLQNLSQEEQDIINIKNTATFIKPVEGTISSKFGQRENATGTVPKNHTGTDIAANMGTKIISATDGEVVLSSEEGDYGKHLKIQIGEVSIIYAHCNNLYVKQGDIVKQGQEIAEVGSTRKFNTGLTYILKLEYKKE